MSTWNDETPPELEPVRLPGRLLGVVRVAALVVVTGISLVLFLIGRALRALLGRWITFHFLVARLWSRISLFVLGVGVSVHGTPIRSGALVANHSTWMDIIALRSVRLIYFVSKSEVASWPGIGYLARIAGTVFINRRRTEAKAQEAILRERIAHDQLLCFFPEGTSTDGRRVLPFKSSLFSAFFEDKKGTDIEIQPVTLHYTAGPGLPSTFLGWWGAMSFEGHIWDVVTRLTGAHVTLVFHPPVTAAELQDRKKLAEHCQTIVAGEFTRRDAGFLQSRPDILTNC